MTVNNILNYNTIIKNLIDNASDINSLVKFKLLGMLKQFEPVVQNFEAVREEQIKKFGKEDGNGGFGIIAPVKDDFEDEKEFEKAQAEFEETIKKFSDALDEVLKSETEIKLKKFKVNDIMNAGLPADYLMALYDLIEE